MNPSKENAITTAKKGWGGNGRLILPARKWTLNHKLNRNHPRHCWGGHAKTQKGLLNTYYEKLTSFHKQTVEEEKTL